MTPDPIVAEYPRDRTTICDPENADAWLSSDVVISDLDGESDG